LTPAPLSPAPQVTILKFDSPNLLNYIYIDLSCINSTDELGVAIRNLEMRQLFKLPSTEIIVHPNISGTYMDLITNTTYNGSIFLSNTALLFASIITAKIQSPINFNIKLLSLIDAEPEVLINIPYSHIVSVKKQPPLSGKRLTAISLSGYLVISTKFSKEYSFTFSSVKIRDTVSDNILSVMKQTGIDFNEDLVIGQRNGVPVAHSAPIQKRLSKASATSLTPEAELGYTIRSSLETIEGLNGAKISEYFIAPLKYVFNPPENIDEKELNPWSNYFRVNGKSISQAIIFTDIRQMLVETCGIPSNFRGDFWYNTISRF
jgi:hypothetical protein